MYNPILGPFKILGVVALIGILMGFGFSAMHKNNTTDQSGRVVEVKEEPVSEPSRVTEVSFSDTGCVVTYNYGGSVGGKNTDDGSIVERCNYDGTEESTQDELNCLAYACLKN